MPKGAVDLDFEKIYLDTAAAGLAEQMEDELFSFADLLREKYELKLFLEDLRVAADYKKKKLDGIWPPGISRNFIALIHVLIDHGREELIEELAGKFTKRYFNEAGIDFGVAYSVCPLFPDIKGRLERVMEHLQGRPVKLRYRLNPTLLGGVMVCFINGKLWDVTLKHKLNSLKTIIMGD